METRGDGAETALDEHNRYGQQQEKGLDNSVINDINMLSHNHSITQNDLIPAITQNSRARTQPQTGAVSSQNTQPLNKNGTLSNILSSQALKDQQPVFVPLDAPDGEEADRRVCQYYYERYKQLSSEPSVRIGRGQSTG